MEVLDSPRSVGLVLSGGGARGFAHIGVLRVLEHTDIEVDVVAGTSMGAIVGALYASGMSAEDIYRLAQGTSWRDVIDLSLNIGLMKGEKLHSLLSQNLPATFAELEKPLVIATTDIETGEEVYITEGNLVAAIRAASSYPGAFEPVQIRGRTLADGGIINNLPVEALSFLGATYTIASDVTPPRRAVYNDPKETAWWERMVATVKLERRTAMAQMVLRSSDIMQSLLTEIQYTLHPADIRVQLSMPQVRIEAFWDFERIVEMGRQAAEHTFRNAGLLKDEAAGSEAAAVSDGRKEETRVSETRSRFPLKR